MFSFFALKESGRVYTWGDGRMGQLGNLARKHNMQATPKLVERLATYEIRVSQISCGQYHTVCLTGFNIYIIFIHILSYINTYIFFF